MYLQLESNQTEIFPMISSNFFIILLLTVTYSVETREVQL